MKDLKEVNEHFFRTIIDELFEYGFKNKILTLILELCLKYRRKKGNLVGLPFFQSKRRMIIGQWQIIIC